jgi:hypothetical protein
MKTNKSINRSVFEQSYQRPNPPTNQVNRGSKSRVVAMFFLRYCDGKICNANSASAALNKWMKKVIGDDFIVHGLRHSLRDRLRAIECPSDIIDAIGGWAKRNWPCVWQRLWPRNTGKVDEITLAMIRSVSFAKSN